MGAGASVGEDAGDVGDINHDPWAGHSAEETLRLIKEEEGEPVEGLNIDDFKAAAPADKKTAIFHLLEGCELTDEDLSSFLLSCCADKEAAAAAARITLLNLGSNSLQTVEALDNSESNVTTNIRSLVLSSNSGLDSVPRGLKCCPLLVDLDLSYNEQLFTAFFGATEEQQPPPFAHLGGTLLRLNLTSVGLPHLGGSGSGVPQVFGGLKLLKSLSLAENQLSDFEGTSRGLEPLALTLEELDLQENPMCEEPSESAYREYRQSRLGGSIAFPLLRWIDGKSLIMDGKVRGIGEVVDDGKSSGMIGDAPAMASLEKEVNAAMNGQVDNTIVA